MSTTTGDGSWEGGDSGSVPPPKPPEPAHIPRYQRENLLGRGGMGVVYLAHDQQLQRWVALKEAIQKGDISERLSKEAQVTAGLEHPGIVTIHDNGTTEDGRPYYTMRLLRGRSLSAILKEKTTLKERLSLLRHYLDVCNAIAYAHAQQVIHRDIKPANIMIGGFGETQVVDWGLALKIDETTQWPTDSQTILGTIAYMSPEQARGEKLDFRSDIWSLGGVLFEILSGQPPRGKGNSAEILKRAKESSTDLLPANIPVELKAIVARAMAPQPKDRYPDAALLAADMEAWLEGRQVEAHTYTAMELLLRLIKAWRIPLTVATVALFVMIALISVGTWRLAQERDRVQVAEQETRMALVESDHHLAQALVAQARTAMLSGSSAVASVLASHSLTLDNSPEAWGIMAGTALELYAEKREEHPLPDCLSYLLVADQDMICLQNTSVERLRYGQQIWKWSGQGTRIFLENNRVFVEVNQALVTLDVETGQIDPKPWKLSTANRRQIWPVMYEDWFSKIPDLPANAMDAILCPKSISMNSAHHLKEKRYVAICEDGLVTTGIIGQPPFLSYQTPLTRSAIGGVVSTLYAHEQQLMVLGGPKGAIMTIDLRTGQIWQNNLAHQDVISQLAISTDGKYIAAAGDWGGVEIVSLPDLVPLLRIPSVHPTNMLFLSDKNLLITEKQKLSQWEIPIRDRLGVIKSASGLSAVSYSPDGKSIATAHGNGDVHLWDWPSGKQLASDHRVPTAKSTVFTPDSQAAWFSFSSAPNIRPLALHVNGQLGPVLSDALLRQWSKIIDIPENTTPSMIGRRIAILNNYTLLFASYMPILGALDLKELKFKSIKNCPALDWLDLAQSIGGEYAVLSDGHNTVSVISGDSCIHTWTIPGAGAVDISANGDRVVISTDDALQVLDAQGQQLWQQPALNVLDVSISADGHWVAAGTSDHIAKLWEGNTGRFRAIFPGHTDRVSSVDFRADGRILVSGSWDGTARFWSLDVLETDPLVLATQSEKLWNLPFQEALAAAVQ